MKEITEDIRETVEKFVPDYIEIAVGEDDTGTVIARYPDKATLDAATDALYAYKSRGFGGEVGLVGKTSDL